MAFFGNGDLFGQGFLPASLLYAQQNQQPAPGGIQAPQQPAGSFFGSDPNAAQSGGLLGQFGSGREEGQQAPGGSISPAPPQEAGGFFGGGKREPSFEEQEREYSSIRDQVMKDPGSAALLAGLSILSANRPRNGRTPGLGELAGAGGLGMIQGLGQMQQAQDARERERQLSQYRGLQMENMRGSMADAQRKREAMARLQEPGGWTEENISAAFPELNVQNRYRREADERDYQQRLDMLAREQAFSRSQQDRSLAERDRSQYDPRLGGYVNPDGSFTPIQLPEGYTSPKAQVGEYLPIDASARKDLAFLSGLDSSIDYIEDAIDTAYPEEVNNPVDTASPKKINKPGGTGLVVGAMPNSWSSRLDKEGVPLRSAISNFSSQIMNALSGAAVSEQERIRLEGFLPTVYDNEDTLRDKIQGYRDYVQTKGNSWRNVYGDNPAFGRMKTFSKTTGNKTRPPLSNF